MSKVSVIIPVYNCNPIFIQQAIDSILSQTYKNIELIIVNDGSTNNETLEYLRSIDTNKIKLFNQKNQGAAIARLTGFKHSTGDYISFIDADDWLDNNYYKTLINLCEKHSADIACATLCRVENDNQFDMDKFDNVVLSDFVEKMQFVTNGSISSKLFKRSLFSLLKCHIKKRYWEDNPVLVEAFLKSNNVVFTNTVRYYYRENPTSTCKDPSKLYKRQIDGLYVLNEIYKIVKNEKKYVQKIAIDKFSFLRGQETYSNSQEYNKNAKQILNKELFEYFRTGILNSSLENIFSIFDEIKRNDVEIMKRYFPDWYIDKHIEGDKRNTFLKTLFSIRNNHKHKLITLLGIKFKIKSKKLIEKQRINKIECQLKECQSRLKNLEIKYDNLVKEIKLK